MVGPGFTEGMNQGIQNRMAMDQNRRSNVYLENQLERQQINDVREERDRFQQNLKNTLDQLSQLSRVATSPMKRKAVEGFAAQIAQAFTPEAERLGMQNLLDVGLQIALQQNTVMEDAALENQIKAVLTPLQPAQTATPSIRAQQDAARQANSMAVSQPAQPLRQQTDLDRAVTMQSQGATDQQIVAGQMPQESVSVKEQERAEPLNPALEKELVKEAAKQYTVTLQKLNKIRSFEGNIREAANLIKNYPPQKSGAVAGRIADMIGDPEFKDLQGALNTLSLQARTLLELPASGFSDADRAFLEDISGGKYSQLDAYKNSTERLIRLTDRAVQENSKYLEDIITGKVFTTRPQKEKNSQKEKINNYDPFGIL